MSQTSTSARTRRRLAAGAAAGALVLAACGGGSDDAASGAQAGEALPEVDTDTGAGASAESEPAAAEPVQLTSGMVDLVGPEVQASSSSGDNLLPDVVVDDVSTGRKVNFRNLVPQEKPILLWMYAPH